MIESMKKEGKMNNLLKILHINPSWEVVYILIGDGIFVKSNVPLEEAIPMLKNDNFDLILSEPQNIAILDHPTDSGKENLFDKKLVLNGRGEDNGVGPR
jgi:hypothetical protein